MKICKTCSQVCEDIWDICPVCHGSLFDTPQNSNAAISMGNANAVSGGIHHSTDNSIKQDNSVSSSHNVSDSHNMTTNNIYQGPVTKIEREKSQDELFKEHKLEYRNCCKKVLADGILTREERLWLEDQRISLDLSDEIATHILNDVQRMCQKPMQKMGKVQHLQYKEMEDAIKDNSLLMVRQLFPGIEVFAKSYQDEDLQFLYHLILAALYPQKCIDIYTQCKEDKYWLSYWTYVAYRKLGDVPNAKSVIVDLDKWNGIMPEDNLLLLEAFGALIDGNKHMAKVFLRDISEKYSHLLSDLYEVIKTLIDASQNKTGDSIEISRNSFYVDHFLKELYEKENKQKQQKQQEERKRKEAEENRRIEEQRSQEEARKKREAEEQARREKEERLRIEERKRWESEEKEKKVKLASIIAMLQEHKNNEENPQLYTITLVSVADYNKLRTIKAIQGLCKCSLQEAHSYIDNLPLEIVVTYEEVSFIKTTLEELGASVQLQEYIENNEDEEYEIESCPNCDSTNVTDNGEEYMSFFCNDCGNRYGYRNDLKCPKCGSMNIWDDGTEDEDGLQYFCVDCEHLWGNHKKVKDLGIVWQYGKKNILRFMFVEGNGTIPDFYISDIPITQGIWNEVMGEKKEIKYSKYGVGDNYPMYYVNIEDCQKFIEKFRLLFVKDLLKNQDSDEGLFNELFDNLIFSLPTEAQWIWAAWGSGKYSELKYSGSNNINEVAWFSGNSEYQTHEVKTKKPNSLEIYDMTGNVLEWCHMGYGDTDEYVCKGGCWNHIEDQCNIMSRYGFSPQYTSPIIGFRIILQIKMT